MTREITIDKKETIEGCNGHDRNYDELMDDKGNLRPLVKEPLFYITVKGMQIRLCQGCLDKLFELIKAESA